MAEGRLQRTRATLPEGYQFGDAGPRLAFHPDAFALAMKPLTLCAPDVNQYRVEKRSIDRVYDSGPVRLERGVRYVLTRSDDRCVCQSLIADASSIAIGEAVTCPAHPERTIRRGPTGATD